MRAPFVVLIACACALISSAWMCPASAHAGEVAAGVRKATKYVGEPFGVFVRAEGFDEDPSPTCTPGTAPDGVTIVLEQVIPEAKLYVKEVNGQRTERREVSFTYQFRAVASKAGRITFPPFVIKQGTESAETRPVVVDVQSVDIDNDIEIRLELPEGPYAPGERVPVTIRWTAVGDPDDALDPQIRSPFLNKFRFEDTIAQRRPALYITTDKGRLPLKASRSRVTHNGKPATQWVATRIWRVEQVGTFEFAPITALLPRVARWRQTFLGREPAEVRRVRTAGKALKIVVAPLPAQGRPPSFAGAVGRGFTISATADRSVMRVGDPVRLRITLRGDGTLDLAGLPRLTDGGGLDANDFTQSDADVTGTITDDAKVFEVTVRVARDGVTSVPPLSYSWWNPTRKAYETAQSKPIALQVGEAKIVSATDVISAGGTNTPEPGTTDAPATRMSMASGADLALVEDLSQLRKQPSSSWGPWLLYGLAALTGLYIIGARRKANEDPTNRDRQSAASQAERTIRAAAKQPAAEAAKATTAALRQLRATYPSQTRSSAWESVLASLDAIAYRPTSDTGALPTDLVDAACAAAQEAGQ